jgi:hypothetical protein
VRARHVLVIAALAASPALAAEHTAAVVQVRVDSALQAPICAATAPAMPGGVWACFQSTRPHYLEMKELLLRAAEAKATCRFEWTQADSMTNSVRVDALSCRWP